MKEVVFIFPHQLFLPHPAVAENRQVVLIEEPLFFGNDRHWPMRLHVQKLVLHRASLAAYAEELKELGHEVQILRNPGGQKVDSLTLWSRAWNKSRAKVLHVADPVDDVLERRLKRFAKRLGLKLIHYPSPNFLTPAADLQKFCGGPKRSSMARFYESRRRAMGILIEDDGSPIGGKWSFDAENRLKLPKNHPVPPAPRCQRDAGVEDAIRSVKREFPEALGSADHFRWAVTRREAESWYRQFLDGRFESFGAYEDAVSTQHDFLYHSAITPMLNIGLLGPQQVVEGALSRAMRVEIPMNSLEGFIRQVIGWREFMQGIYRHRGVTVRHGNFWGFSRKLPAAFYDATTGIPPVDRVIRQLLREGWCHHIERLMILGNFMLLCRIHPDEVYRWFMELFVDSYDWVMVPNVYGMSQFADGGTFTTKPYLSGSNYVLNMSDEAKGDWCGVWDALFWTFIADYRDFFLRNPRLTMMVRTWEKMTEEKQLALRKQAKAFFRKLDSPATGA